MLVRSLASGAVADVDDVVAKDMLLKGWVPAGASPKKAVVVEEPAEEEHAAPRKRAAKKAV